METRELIAWSEVFPDEMNLIFKHGDQTIFIDEQYCVTPGCNCKEISLSFVRLEGESSARHIVCRSQSFPGQVNRRRKDISRRNRDIASRVQYPLPRGQTPLSGTSYKNSKGHGGGPPAKDAGGGANPSRLPEGRPQRPLPLRLRPEI